MAILRELADARTVVNVGAGAYEPSDRRVFAVEPASTMIEEIAGHLDLGYRLLTTA